jgi:hypothetical protein
MALRDLQSKNLIVAKGLLFVLLGCSSAILIVVEGASWWKRLLLLAVCVWAFCRAYYFAFYVIARYLDPGYKYSGLLSAIRYLLKKPGAAKRSDRDHA